MTESKICTCPSGDGSLVHPCPAHPAVEQAGGDERAKFEYWASDEGIYPKAVERSGNCYKLAQTQSYWMAWQARAALAQPSQSQYEAGFEEWLANELEGEDGQPVPAAVCDIALARRAFNHWPKLEHPAKVGGVRFSAGVSSRLVVEAAQRLYEFESTPEKEAERIERLQAFREQLDPLNLAPHAEAFNEAPADALRPEQAEAERPEVVGYRSMESGMVYEQDYGLKDPEALTTVAECDSIVGELRAEIAQLRQHKNDYMDAGQETYRALQNEIREREAEIARLDGLVSRRTAERDAALAQPSPVRSSLLINGYQLRAALDFIAPDGTAEQLKSEACIEWRQQDADFLEAGLYAFCAEYPEEGGVLLDEEPTTAQPSPLQSEQAEAERPELWAVHAQGPDELYAAFTREDAEKHAAELNALPMPEGIAVGAVVVPSPWPAVQHWQYLAEQEQDHKNEIAGRLRQLERICEGLPQDAIDGGWTVQGIRGYAKRLEDQLKAALARVAELEKQEPVVRAYGVLPPFAEKVLAKLRRFYDCAEDFESGGVDIGRHWLDLLTQLGLLNRVQRSPALWEISQHGEDLLEAPVAQAQQLNDLDKQCRDDVARALGLRPNQERGFAWSYLLASIKSCVKASGDSAQAQHSVPDGAADLCRFLAKLYCELDGLRYSTAKLPAEQIADALIFKWPVLQGARNQLNIKRISEQPYDESKLHSAIAAMLAAAPGKEGV